MKLKEWKCMSMPVPIIGHNRQHSAHRLVMKTSKKSPLIIPTKLKDDY